MGITRESKDVVIPHEVANRTDLSAGHKMVIGEMMRKQSDGTHFKLSYGLIAKATGLNRRHVIRIAQDLITRKMVRRTKHGREEVNTFSVVFANNRNRKRRFAAAAAKAAG